MKYIIGINSKCEINYNSAFVGDFKKHKLHLTIV